MSSTLPDELGFLAPVWMDTTELIRVGNAHDGGYVIPKAAVHSADALVSFGVGKDWTFEENCLSLNPRLQIHAYDHTVGETHFSRAYIRGIAKFLLGRASRAEVSQRRTTLRAYRKFFRTPYAHAPIHFREAIHPRVHAVTHATIDKVFSRVRSHKVLMKIDIEGMEYQILDDVLRHADKICCLVMECHDTQYFRETFVAQMKRLQRKFQIVHVHGTNLNHIAPDGLPNCLEITFLAGCAQSHARRRYSLPLEGLDSPNHPTAPDRAIQFPEVRAPNAIRA